MTMDRTEFLSIADWRHEFLLQGTVYSPFLGHEVEVSIGFNQFKSNRELSDFAIRSLNAFLELDTSNFTWIRAELWKHCEATFQSASYGIPRKKGQSEYEANQDFFDIHDPEAAFGKSRARYVFIDNDNAGDSETCFFLEYETPWDREHNMIFVFRNGRQHAVE